MSKLILKANEANPLDISQYIYQHININETPNYVDGANIGLSKNGRSIFDRIHTAYSFSVPLKPLTEGVFRDIITACEANEMYVNYESARGNILVRAQVSLSGWHYALDKGEKIYDGAVITVQGA